MAHNVFSSFPLHLAPPLLPPTLSVMIPVMSAAGVTSKEGFHTVMPEGATCGPQEVKMEGHSRSELIGG